MNIPSEISALIRASAATVKAHRRVRQAELDEASGPVRAKHYKALHDALDVQDAALAKVAALAKRPNAPVDFAGLLNGVVRVIGAVKSGDAERALRDRVKGVIDVEPAE